MSDYDEVQVSVRMDAGKFSAVLRVTMTVMSFSIMHVFLADV